MKNSIVELKLEDINNISGGMSFESIKETTLNYARMIIISTSPIIGAIGAYGIIRLLSKDSAS